MKIYDLCIYLPKHLNWRKDFLLDDGGTNECDGNSDDVDGQLELQEFLDRFVDVSSPHNCC